MVSVSLCVTGTYSIKILSFFNRANYSSCYCWLLINSFLCLWKIFSGLTWNTAPPPKKKIISLNHLLLWTEGLAGMVPGEGWVCQQKSVAEKIIRRNSSGRWMKEAPEQVLGGQPRSWMNQVFSSAGAKWWQELEKTVLWLLLLTRKKAHALSSLYTALTQKSKWSSFIWKTLQALLSTSIYPPLNVKKTY